MRNKGFIQLIIIIILVVILLSLLGVSLGSIFSNPILKDNFGLIGRWLSKIWNQYLSAQFVFIWGILKNLFSGIINIMS